MSKKNTAAVQDTTGSVGSILVPIDQPATVVPSPTPQDRISNDDLRVLELAKARLETAQAQAKEAAARLETAQIAYRYIVLQIYMQNGLSTSDALSETGEIIRGGAVQTQQR
jgi:hypothetical protein